MGVQRRGEDTSQPGWLKPGMFMYECRLLASIGCFLSWAQLPDFGVSRGAFVDAEWTQLDRRRIPVL